MQDAQKSWKIMVERSAEEATALASELIKTIICESAAEENKCYVALAGGTTPHALYQQLADTCASGDVPWGNVEVFFGDERDVPHDDVESNYNMATKTLLDNVPVQPTRIHPMSADSPDLAAAAEEYQQVICNLVPGKKKGISQFDLILLGMGADGHVASLFPGTEALKEREKLVTACFIPVLGRNRMTFTFPLINAARNVMLLVTGDDKADAIAALLGDDPAAKEQLPAVRIDPEGIVFLVLDAAAAKRTGLKSA